MQRPYPLRFQPVFRDYLWGGRRLQTELNKPLPDDGKDYAESWEIVDHGQDQSVVANGVFQGETLAALVAEQGEWLLGKHHPVTQFPLLFKFLDCQRKLSVQVHPNDRQGAQLDPPDLGKTEAWVIMSAEPGSTLYAGLRYGVDETKLRQHITEGTVDQALHQVQPQAGDCVFIPAGTVHALGDGLLVAEIQQSSNTTFRLFDWNRTGTDGKSRPLHIDQGLGVIDFERGPVEPVTPEPTNVEHVERLVQCDKFVLDRLSLRSNTQACSVGGDNRCHIVVPIQGKMEMDGCKLEVGESALLPAASAPAAVTCDGQTMILDMYLP